MRPRRCFSPLESSPGTRPEIGHQRRAARETVGSRATRPGSASPSTCRCRGSTAATPTGSRYGSVSAISRQLRHRAPQPRLRCDRSPADSPRRPRARPACAHSRRLDPLPVRLRPVAPGVVQAAAQQQLAQAMAAALQILPGIIARPAPDRGPPRPPASAAAPRSAAPRAAVPPACAHRGDRSSPARPASAGISAGAITCSCTRAVVTCRCNA